MRWVVLIIFMILSAGCGPMGESDLDSGRTVVDESDRRGNDEQPVDDGDGNAGSCKQQVNRKSKSAIEAFDYYISDVYPVLQTECASCHSSDGDASYTAFVMSGDAESDYEQVKSLTERDVGGYPYLLMKATGFAGHTGGARFSIDSPEAQSLQHFADLLSGDVQDDSGDVDEPAGCADDGSTAEERPRGEGLFKDVYLLTNKETLNKASMLMLGKRAPIALQMLVSDGTKESLKKGLRQLMQGPEFREFLIVGANDQLLTDKLKNRNLLTSISSELSYYRFSQLDWPGIMPTPDNVSGTTYNWALAEEALRLIAYVVENERDYREILTADYTVFNSLTHEFFDWQQQGYVEFVHPDTGEYLSPPKGPEDWLPGRFAPGVGTGYFIDDGQSRHPAVLRYPHAGVVTTRPWLSRWQNTNTNGQRKRAKMLLKQFLGYDIERTAARPMSNTSLQDGSNPTFNNPECTGCHKPLDALAGSFQNWGYHGRFRLNEEAFTSYRAPFERKDALSEGYKLDSSINCGKPLGEGGYCEGDLWYADRFPTGFVFQGESEITLMPNDGPGRAGSYDNATLRWAVEQLVRDPRFATGTVEFWWEAVFNRKPLRAPVEGAPDYKSRLEAYIAQQQLIVQTAQVFQHDNGYGSYNLKDLLAELFSSDWFRAHRLADRDLRVDAVAFAGMGTLLTPEQLDRKLRNTLGIKWSQLLDSYNVAYGGIDSENVVERNRMFNPLMFNVMKRMVSEVACEVVHQEFIDDPPTPSAEHPMWLRHRVERKLFALYDGEVPDESYPIRRVIAHLHRQLWNEDVSLTSAEVEKSLMLFKELWDYESGENSEDMRCTSNPSKTVVPIDQDTGEPAYSHVAMRVWRDMLVYFMLNRKFLYE